VSDALQASPQAAPALPWPGFPPWHDGTLATLGSDLHRLPHALLIHGPAGIGKHAFALHLAQVLLCEARGSGGRACGKCPGCRYAGAGQHPDLLRIELATIEPETGEVVTSETIAIDRIRGLIEFAQLTSHRHAAKVAVIAPAERMNAAAANALLKTLEEPPPQTYFLLVSHQPGSVPATIASRCVRLPLLRPDAGSARDWLAEQGVKDAALVLAQADGAPLAALALADPAIQQERRRWLDALARPEALPVVELAARIDAGAREERKARLGLALDWMLAWTGDLARVLAGAVPTRHPDFASALAALASRVAPIPLFRYHRQVLEQRSLLGHPLQPRLVAEALLADYRVLFRPVKR
jgi:DNA polymerase-3 subunit delta'